MSGTNLNAHRRWVKSSSSLEAVVDTLDQMKQGLEDVSGLLELAVEADDEETFNEAVAELDALEEKLAQLEFRRMFSGEYDSADCYLRYSGGVWRYGSTGLGEHA